MSRPRKWTDEQLASAVAASTTMSEVCRRIGIQPGRYDLLRKHIARIGVDASHLPGLVPKPSRRHRWTDDDLRDAVRSATSMAGVMAVLGYQPSGGTHRSLVGHIRRLDLDTSHFLGRAWSRGLKVSSRPPTPLTDVLVAPSIYSSSLLRRRLIAEGVKPARCEWCGIDEWHGQTLPLTLDHVNGDHTDNRLDNLRILCPNCHALTRTWCVRKA